MNMLAIFRSEGDIWKLFSALAVADFMTFATARAVGPGANPSIASDSSTFLPRTLSATKRNLRGEIPTYLAIALASMAGLYYLLSASCFPAHVASESSSGGEFP